MPGVVDGTGRETVFRIRRLHDLVLGLCNGSRRKLPHCRQSLPIGRSPPTMRGNNLLGVPQPVPARLAATIPRFGLRKRQLLHCRRANWGPMGHIARGCVKLGAHRNQLPGRQADAVGHFKGRVTREFPANGYRSEDRSGLIARTSSLGPHRAHRQREESTPISAGRCRWAWRPGICYRALRCTASRWGSGDLRRRCWLESPGARRGGVHGGFKAVGAGSEALFADDALGADKAGAMPGRRQRWMSWSVSSRNGGALSGSGWIPDCLAKRRRAAGRRGKA
jgi:hypothetical protein